MIRKQYLDWRRQNPQGFVLNINIWNPNSNTYKNIIHKASWCSSLDTPPTANRERPITPEHPKLCSTDIHELENEIVSKGLPYKFLRALQPKKPLIILIGGIDVENKESMVREWYLSIVKPAELDNKILATLTYFKRFNEPENNKWTIWAYEFVSGNHEMNAGRIFLDQVQYQGQKIYMKEKGAPSQKEVKQELKDISRLVADNFNRFTKLHGTFRVGHNQADGSFGVFYEEHI